MAQTTNGPVAATPTILLAEDEFIVAMELEQHFEARGFAVLGPAPSVAVALSLLARQRPDVAVLDVNLQGERVTPVAEALAAAGVPFLIVSGYGADHLTDAVLASAPRLSKPYEEAALDEALAALGAPAGAVGAR